MPKNTALSVQVCKSAGDVTPLADLSTRWTSLSYSTALHGGFADLSLFAPMDVGEVWTALHRENLRGWHFRHLRVMEGRETRWEGRVMTVSLEVRHGEVGLSLTALGYWSSLADQRVTTVDYSAGTHTVDSIIKAMLTAHCPDISTDQSLIEAVAGNVNLTLPVDGYTLDHICDSLAPLGDTSFNVYYAGVYESRKCFYRARSVTEVDWEVRLRDIESGNITQDGQTLRNAADAFDGTTRTASNSDSQSTALYPTRDAVVAVPEGTTAARKTDARDRFIAQARFPQQASAFTIIGDPLPVGKVNPSTGTRSAIRAGDVLKVIDLIPASAASPSLDGLRTFYLLGTHYQADRDVVTVYPDRPQNDLASILSRNLTLETPR